MNSRHVRKLRDRIVFPFTIVCRELTDSGHQWPDRLSVNATSDGRETRTQSVAGARNLNGPTAWGLGPLVHMNSPVLTWCARVAGNHVNMQVGYRITEYERVHMHRTFDFPQCAGDIPDQNAESGCFLMPEFAKTDNMTSRLHHHVTQIHVRQIRWKYVPDIEEIVLKHRADWAFRRVCVLETNEAFRHARPAHYTARPTSV